MSSLPTDTVTFLFTDVEGSTRLWERHPGAMRVALARHDALIEQLTERHGGAVVRPRGEGDSRFCVFARASAAAVSLGGRGGAKGGPARAAKLSPERRREIARGAAAKRWGKPE